MLAEKIMRDRKAREKGRIWLYSLEDAMEALSVTSYMVAEQVGIGAHAVHHYARLDYSAPIPDAEAIADVLGVALHELVEGGVEHRGEAFYELFFVGMPELRDLERREGVTDVGTKAS